MLLRSRRVWISGQFYPAILELKAGKISRILPYDHCKPDEDYGGCRIVPGFIDLHTHGAYGIDASFATPSQIIEWAKKAAKEGVTAFLPTTFTHSGEVLTEAARNIAAAINTTQNAPDFDGAEILGIHFEGPYLGIRYKGAQPEAYIVKPDIAQFDSWQQAAGGHIRLITVAPEKDDSFSFIRYARSNGVAINMGHTSATYEQAVLAAANGADGITHTHNAMSPYSHKEPGILNAALSSGDIFCEIIPDGIHVPFPLVRTLFGCKGDSHVVMVTDSLPLKGMDGKPLNLLGQEIEARDGGGAVLKGTTTLAGSTVFLAEGLRNLVEEALIPFDMALNSCTSGPARRIGVSDYKGAIRAGYDSDIVVLADDYAIVQTYCRGRKQL